MNDQLVDDYEKMNGNSLIRRKTGNGMWDIKMYHIPNTRITDDERTILSLCSDNMTETKKHIPFFLLRFYHRYYINFESYAGAWIFYYPNDPVDQTSESFFQNRGKWVIGTESKTSNLSSRMSCDTRSECLKDSAKQQVKVPVSREALTNAYVVPFIPELIIN